MSGMNCKLERLVGRGFKTIVADPPWRYGKWGNEVEANKEVTA